MAGKFLDKTGLQHFWDKVKAKMGNYLPLSGGTVNGNLTVVPPAVDGGVTINDSGTKIQKQNASINVTGNAVSIMNGSNAIGIGATAVKIGGTNAAFTTETLIRTKMPESPEDTEIPTVGWVKNNVGGSEQGYTIQNTAFFEIAGQNLKKMNSFVSGIFVAVAAQDIECFNSVLFTLPEDLNPEGSIIGNGYMPIGTFLTEGNTTGLVGSVVVERDGGVRLFWDSATSNISVITAGEFIDINLSYTI